MATPIPPRPRTTSGRLQLGYIDNFYSRPLTRGIEAMKNRFEIHCCEPDTFFLACDEGLFDVVLLPSPEVFTRRQYAVLPNICVACYGPARIALMCAQNLPTEIRTILVDRNTPALTRLLEVLIPRQLMIHPELCPVDFPDDPSDFNFSLDPQQACLFSGARALLTPPGAYIWTWDLIQAWINYCRTPFVLMAWGIRRDLRLDRIVEDLEAVRQWNLSHLDQLCLEESQRTKVDAATLRVVYGRHFQYTLDSPQIAGLRRFGKEMADAGLIPGNTPVRIYRTDSPTAYGA